MEKNNAYAEHENCVSLILDVVMSSVIKLFHTLKIFYKKIGLSVLPSQLHQPTCSLNLLNICLLISPIPLYISSTAFYLFEAETADENGTSFYISVTIFAIAINISIIASKMTKILALIEKYEEFITKS